MPTLFLGAERRQAPAPLQGNAHRENPTGNFSLWRIPCDLPVQFIHAPPNREFNTQKGLTAEAELIKRTLREAASPELVELAEEHSSRPPAT
jgi:hypothetical protein